MDVLCKYHGQSGGYPASDDVAAAIDAGTDVTSAKVVHIVDDGFVLLVCLVSDEFARAHGFEDSRVAVGEGEKWCATLVPTCELCLRQAQEKGRLHIRDAADLWVVDSWEE